MRVSQGQAVGFYSLLLDADPSDADRRHSAIFRVAILSVPGPGLWAVVPAVALSF